MIQSLLAGVSGIKAQSTRMNAISNDLTNVNTTAFKGSHVEFAELISQTFTGATAPSATSGGRNPIQSGLGVVVSASSSDMNQGSLSSTNNPSDLALQGEGFFPVTNGSAVSYTRDGGFNLDSSGNIVHRATGDQLLGWKADANGKIDTSAPITKSSILNVPIGSSTSVQPTTSIQFTGNLNSQALAADTWTSTITGYDSLGAAQPVQITFKNHTNTLGGGAPAGATSSWDWSASVNGTAIGSTASGGAPLYFDATGKLVNAAATQNGTLAGTGGAASTTIAMDFSKVTQLSANSGVQASNQNGYPAGSLQSYQIGNDGVITGTFTNGLTRALGQVATANFTNPAGLTRNGSNLWSASSNSGLANTGVAGTGGRGQINAGYLEQSNVDLSKELTDLIVTQRGYSANTKIITTVDEMMQELLSIKR